MKNPVRDSYCNHQCPDCGTDIPARVQSGDGCRNCGHVFTAYKQLEDEPALFAWDEVNVMV